MLTEKDLMERCQQLAEHGARNGNSPVGAVVVSEGVVLGEGYEAVQSKKDITCHAELEAIRAALVKLYATDLSGCILYSSHEPCIMCSYAIRYYQISKVVFQKLSAKLGGVSSVLPMLTTTETPAHWSKPPEIVQLQDE
jgi:tRNA(adenine34) deaminase